jgi:ABC-type transporter Mla subunit MlaD
MAKPVVVMLERARAQRAMAERARRLARSIPTQGVVDELERHAGDLEQAAAALEQRADALSETTAKAGSLSADIHRLIGEAQARLDALGAPKPKSR